MNRQISRVALFGLLLLAARQDNEIQRVAQFEIKRGLILASDGHTVLASNVKRKAGGKLPEPARGSGAGIHMPPPSYWPFLAAWGILIFFVGFLVGVKLPIILAGAALLLVSVFNWAFEPVE